MKQNSLDLGCATPPAIRQTGGRGFWRMSANCCMPAFVATALLNGFPGLAAETNALATPPGWLTQPMSLTDAVSRALQSNSAILEGRSDLEAAHGLVVQTRAIALPKLRGASGYAHNEAVERFPFSGSETIFPLKVN